MNIKKKVLSFAVLVTLFSQMALPGTVYAAGIVGSGTPESCTEASLDSALTAGGAVSFDCGGPATIILTNPKVITSNTQIDGAGLITLSGGNTVRLFTVNSSSTLNLSNLTISNGFVTDQNGGAILVNSGTTVNISNTTLSSNQSINGYGGAIYVGGGNLNVTNSTFTNNSANVEILGELALGGGAIENNDGTVTIDGSTFNGNSVISHTADGGAIYNGDFDATVVGNLPLPDSNPDVLTVTNSTFYGNHIVNPNTGGEGDSGGAIRSTSVLTLIHNTFSNNDSGDVVEDGDESGAVTISHGTATLKDNIFANSTAADCATRSTMTSLISTGNLIENNFAAPRGCGTPAQTADPLLGPLQNNGGPTQTMALLHGSPAINTGNNANCSGTDQRGVTRPQGSQCDLGAYELIPATVNVSIGSNGMGTYPIPFNSPLIKTYPSTVNGPVKVVSTLGDPVFTSQRAIYGNSFNELTGFPADQLTTDYWFTYYDDVYMSTWLMIGNPDPVNSAHVEVYLGSSNTPIYTQDLSHGQSVLPRFGVAGGPLRVKSTNGVKIFTSERAAYLGSFNELMGFPANQLTTDYWFTYYDDIYMSTWLMIGNPDPVNSAHVEVYLGNSNTPIYTQDLAHGQSVLPRFAVAGGPLRVTSTNGVNIFTSERSAFGNSFNELMGFPANQLTTDYWYTYYDDVSMKTWLMIGNPDPVNSAHVEVYLGSSNAPIYTVDLTHGQSVLPRLGIVGGPLRVKSTNGVNIFTSERVAYGNSFNELMGFPANQLTTDYWFTYYDNVYMSTKLMIGATK